jgi:hypothetical protein
VGETGSKLQDPRDLAFYQSFKNYVTNTGDAVDGLHGPITSIIWWSWNANSGDTGGIVGDDWVTVNFQKVRLMQDLVNLTPFYGQTPASAPLPSFGLQSVGATPATGPFGGTLYASEFGLNDTLASNNALYGDVPTVVQRLRALGFDSVVFPFSFFATYPKFSFQRVCTVPNVTAVRVSVLPSGFNASNIIGLALPPVTNTAYSTNSTKCDTYVSADTLVDTVSLFTRNGLQVILRNIDTSYAFSQPASWLVSWVNLATRLVNAHVTTNITVSPVVTPTSATWASNQGVPGLNELFYTAMSAIYPVLPTASYLIDYPQNDDATAFFRRILAEPYGPNNVAVISQEDPTVCLTSDTCQQIQAVANYSEGNATTSGGWLYDTGVDVSFTEIEELQGMGLRPWYLPPSGYNYIPGPGPSGEGAVESAPTGPQCTANVTLGNVTSATSVPLIALIEIDVSNLATTSVLTPWYLGFSLPTVQNIVTTYGVTSASLNNGTINATLNTYDDVLFPLGTNVVSVGLTVTLANTSTVIKEVSVGSNVCTVLLD